MKNLLVIGDEVAMLNLLRDILSLKACRAFTTSDADEGSRLLQEQATDRLFQKVASRIGDPQEAPHGNGR